MRFTPIAFLMLLVLGGGILLAQSGQQNLTCDPETLITTQKELDALLEEFEAQLDEDSQTLLAQLYDVGKQYQALALECGYIPDDIGTLSVGNEIDIILRGLEAVNGDPLRGQLLYNNEENAADGAPLGCVGCHGQELTAPLTEGTWTRWDEIRSLEPQFADYDFQHYVVESIIHPWDYVVEGYGETMPANFGNRLNYQDLADLIIYLEGQDQFLD